MNTLREILSSVHGATIVSIDTNTVIKLLGGKKNPDQGHINKISKGHNVMLFSNTNVNGYQNMINKRLVAEGKTSTFEVGPRTWGTRIANTPFIEHNDQTYLEVIFLHPGKVHYERDGVVITKDDIQGFPPEQQEGEQDGLDNKVIIRTFKVSSIFGVTINGKRHEV